MAPKLTVLDAASGAAGPHGTGGAQPSALRAPVARSHTPPPPARPGSPGPLTARGSATFTCAARPAERSGSWHHPSGLPRTPSRETLLAATGQHLVGAASTGDAATVEAVMSSPVAGVLGFKGGVASQDQEAQWDHQARRLTKQLSLNHDKLTTSERCVLCSLPVRLALLRTVCASREHLLTCWMDKTYSLADHASSARVFQYYLPTYLWVLRQLEAHRKQHAGPGEPPALVVRDALAPSLLLHQHRPVLIAWPLCLHLSTAIH